METAVVVFIILGAISGLTRGAGVLQDSLLHASVGGKVIFTTLTPAETPLSYVAWDFVNINNDFIAMITLTTSNFTNPEYEGRITLLDPPGSLELRNLTLSDIGEYRINIARAGEPQQSGHCELDVLVPVSSVVVTSSSTDLMEFSSVSLSCSSSGSSLSFLWLNGSSEVTANERVQITDGGSNLTILSVTGYDQGPFRCHVFNPVSNGSSDAVNLSISFGPENINLKVSPSQGYYEENSNINLSCSVFSSPPALIYWLVNNNLLEDSGPELKLKNIQMNQSGYYSCAAYNSKTTRYQLSKPASISVQEKAPGGLSPGAIAGITIACLIIPAAAVLFYIYRRSKSKPKNQTQETEHTENVYETAMGIYENAGRRNT